MWFALSTFVRAALSCTTVPIGSSPPMTSRAAATGIGSRPGVRLQRRRSCGLVLALQCPPRPLRPRRIRRYSLSQTRFVSLLSYCPVRTFRVAGQYPPQDFVVKLSGCANSGDQLVGPVCRAVLDALVRVKLHFHVLEENPSGKAESRDCAQRRSPPCSKRNCPIPGEPPVPPEQV